MSRKGRRELGGYLVLGGEGMPKTLAACWAANTWVLQLFQRVWSQSKAISFAAATMLL